MSDFPTSEAFFAEIKRLIDAWCERRCLGPLSSILGPYLGFNGLTDGWGELNDGLKTIRASYRDTLPSGELDAVNDLIRAAEKVIYLRLRG